MSFWSVVDWARFKHPVSAIDSGHVIELPKHSLFCLTPECVAAGLLQPCLSIPGTIQDKLDEWLSSASVDRCARPNT
jgi:hypothetical protein